MVAALSLTALTLAVALAASHAADPAPAPSPRMRMCPDEAALEYVRRNPLTARASKLGDLPRPDMELTVLRKVDGCTTPVKVRTSVQGDGRFAHPQ